MKYFMLMPIWDFDYSWRSKTFLRSFAYNIREFTRIFSFVCCGSANRRITSYAKPRPTLAILFADDNSAFGK